MSIQHENLMNLGGLVGNESHFKIGVDDPQLDDAVLSCHSSAQPQVLNRYLRDSEVRTLQHLWGLPRFLSPWRVILIDGLPSADSWRATTL